MSSRERAARNFLNHLKAFANSVQAYVRGIGDITVADRTLLREKWESSPPADDHDDETELNGWHSSDSYDLPELTDLANGLVNGLYAMNEKPVLKVDEYGEPIGVTPRLTKVCVFIFFLFSFLTPYAGLWPSS